MHAERGQLLFRTASLPRRSALLVILGWIGLALLWTYDSMRHGWDAGNLFLSGCYAVMCAVFIFRTLRGVLFYEKGVYFPNEPSGARARFIPWMAIERFHWDGDVLTVVPVSTILGTGGGAPLTGGSVRVPAGRRAEVERLLGTAVG